MIIREITSDDKKAFNTLANHPLQSYEWGEFRESTGVKVVRKGIFEGEVLKRSIQVTIHPIPKTGYSVGYFPKGPMPDEDQLKILRQIGKENNCIMIKMEPNIGSVIKDDSPNVHAWQSIDEFLKNRGCKPGRSLFTRYTFQVSLKDSEEKLLKQMNSKTRYNLNLARRKGVKVGVDDSPSSFEWFLKLLFEQTVVRQGFYAHSPEYFKDMWAILQPAGIAHLMRAYVGDDTLAVFMVFIYNNKIYYPYGASTRSHKELMAPNLLMWELMRLGKEKECELLDMWGAMGPKPNKKDPWYGFHRFKAGYGGNLVEFLGTYDLVINSSVYPIYVMLDKLRWKWLRLRSGLKKIPLKLRVKR